MKNRRKLLTTAALILGILIVSSMIMFKNKHNKENLANKPASNEISNDEDKKKNDGSEKNEKIKEDLSNKTDDNKDTDINIEELNNGEAKNNDTENKAIENQEVEKEVVADNVNSVSGDKTSNHTGTSNNNEQSKVPSKPPVEPVKPEPVEKYITLSITANTILNNMDKVSEGKKAIIPSNGVILGETKVKIEDGDSVFDVLKRETRKNRIHMDFVESPGTSSAYIKGIANIYEFDAGDLSGWMYSVNGAFPGVGASEVKLKDGDNVKWLYTCDLGRDLGHGF